VSDLTVVKVGGSLFDLPELGACLMRWLADLSPSGVLLVPGGGPTADVIRDFDRRHRLGEEKSHWLALRALTLNARILAELLPRSRLVEYPGDKPDGIAILDPFAFCLCDERNHPADALPHSWTVSSDSIAARVAVASSARGLILLKSVTIPQEMSWARARCEGYVDGAFEGLIQATGLQVQVVNFRALTN
jgi:aspartokinase-like uncharacterized kinase